MTSNGLLSHYFQSDFFEIGGDFLYRIAIVLFHITGQLIPFDKVWSDSVAVVSLAQPPAAEQAVRHPSGVFHPRQQFIFFIGEIEIAR